MFTHAPPAGPSSLHYNYQSIVQSSSGAAPYTTPAPYGSAAPYAAAAKRPAPMQMGPYAAPGVNTNYAAYQHGLKLLAEQQRRQQMQQQEVLSPRNQLSGQRRLERKIKKPLMEKKRRERINGYLSELKELLALASPQQEQKLEKADILEMTVEYLRQQVADCSKRGVKRKAPSEDCTTLPSSHSAFISGYTHAAKMAADLLLAAGEVPQPVAVHVHGELMQRLQHVGVAPQRECGEFTQKTDRESVSPSSECENSIAASSPSLCDKSTSFELSSPRSNSSKVAVKDSPSVWRPF